LRVTIDALGGQQQKLILTPHAGELSRLLEAFSVVTAEELAAFLNAIVVCKGAVTQVVSPNGAIELAPGTPALAKAGTGDVLAGIIGSLLAQGMEPRAASVAGVKIHGKAGQLAASNLGVRSVMAEDLLDTLASAIRSFEETDFERTATEPRLDARLESHSQS
jgi:NAD(P)H-hydrate repair Nnr-like enzyme with NAD(P)H-hydrate dehydratase domain